MRGVQIVLVLVVLSTVVATFAHRLRVPPPSLLVVAGVVVGVLPQVPAIQVSPDVVSLVVLPPLLFAAGEELSWPQLRRVWRPVVVLSVGLVLASAGAVGAVATLVTPLPLSMAFLLGAVLASTDPVAVAALGRRLSLPGRLQTLVQAESLFNDATSLILFRIAVAAAVTGGSLRISAAGAQFAVLAGGGVLAGLVVAAGVAFVRSRTEEPVVETVIMLVTPYVAYVLAEAVHASGVTAVVIASITLSLLAPRLSAPTTRLQSAAVQSTVVFILESAVFAVIGLALPSLIQRLSAAGQPWLIPAIVVTVTLLVVRIAWIFPLAAFRSWRHHARSLRGAWRVPAVLSWAGARGVVPLAAALSIPLTDVTGAPMPFRDLVQVIATAVIVISLVVQGFTLAPLVALTGVSVARADEQAELVRVRLHLAETALDYIDGQVDGQVDGENVAPVIVDRMRQSLRAQVELAQAGSGMRDPRDAGYRQLRRAVVLVQRAELERLHATGAASELTRRRIQHQLDLEDARYGEEA
jgi:CPA1 family monovalent cation:H+ antiporter